MYFLLLYYFCGFTGMRIYKLDILQLTFFGHTSYTRTWTNQRRRRWVMIIKMRWRSIFCNGNQIKHIYLFNILVDNFLRWTYFGPSRSIHPWTTPTHTTLRISDVTDNWSSWFVDVTFDWRHVMVTAVERNNQTRRLLTFLRRLLCINLIITSQILNENDVKTKYKYKRWIPFFWDSRKYERSRSRAKLTWRLSGVTYCAGEPLR